MAFAPDLGFFAFFLILKTSVIATNQRSGAFVQKNRQMVIAGQEESCNAMPNGAETAFAAVVPMAPHFHLLPECQNTAPKSVSSVTERHIFLEPRANFKTFQFGQDTADRTFQPQAYIAYSED